MVLAQRNRRRQHELPGRAERRHRTLFVYARYERLFQSHLFKGSVEHRTQVLYIRNPRGPETDQAFGNLREHLQR